MPAPERPLEPSREKPPPERPEEAPSPGATRTRAVDWIPRHRGVGPPEGGPPDLAAVGVAVEPR